MSQGTWIDHFPGNFMWSNATLVCKGMAPYGAVAIGEIDRIGERLTVRGMDDPDAWWQEWCAMAEKNEKLADPAAAEGRDLTAGDHYLRTGNYYYTGERFVPPGARKLGIYKVENQGQVLPFAWRIKRGGGKAEWVVLWINKKNGAERDAS